MDFIHKGHIGFVYVMECVGKDGRVKWRAREENLIPNQGRDYILTSSLLSGAQLPSWYIGLYETAYAPVASETLLTLLANVTESTDYTSLGSLRLELTPSALSNGVFSNIDSPAEFEFTAAKTVHGGFIASSSGQGATAGTLLSVVANSSPKPVEAGEILRVTAGLSLTTV